jgi:2,5-diketo-D-gluconate reductase B
MIESKITEEAITNAYKAGYRHFDCAQVYNNEYEIGKFVKTVERNKVFITTKVWPRNFHSEKEFLKSIKQSLQRLNIEKANLILIHWPIKEDNLFIKAYH